MKRLRVLGICAGNGATLLPFYKSRRFEVVANIEPRAVFHSACSEQWVANYGNTPYLRELVPFQDIDIIVGHPDCGHSSMLTLSRAKTFKDPRDNESLQLFFQALDLYEPNIWLMENLPGLLNTYPRDTLSASLADYKLKFIEEPVSYFGNSQVHRKRLVIVGRHKSIKRVTFATKANPQIETVGELIGDLVGTEDLAFGQVAEPLDKMVCLWWKDRKIDLREARDRWLTDLADTASWPGYYNAKTQPGVYKLFKDGYPRTVRKQNRQFNQLGLPLTPREMARIQGIPDSFELYISRPRLEYWINKSRATVAKCPPYEIFKWFKRNILKNYEALLD